MLLTGDPWRPLVLDLLRPGKPVKKSDIFAGAQKQGLKLTDGIYQRVVTKSLKEICESRAGGWVLNQQLEAALPE